MDDIKRKQLIELENFLLKSRDYQMNCTIKHSLRLLYWSLFSKERYKTFTFFFNTGIPFNQSFRLAKEIK